MDLNQEPARETEGTVQPTERVTRTHHPGQRVISTSEQTDYEVEP